MKSSQFGQASCAHSRPKRLPGNGWQQRLSAADPALCSVRGWRVHWFVCMRPRVRVASPGERDAAKGTDIESPPQRMGANNKLRGFFGRQPTDSE